MYDCPKNLEGFFEFLFMCGKISFFQIVFNYSGVYYLHIIGILIEREYFRKEVMITVGIL